MVAAGSAGRFVRVYADSAGESHFSDDAVASLLEWDGRVTRLVRVKPGVASPLHPEPSPTLATALEGCMDIQTSDGAVRQLEPGTVMRFLDTEGRGHSFTNGPSEALLMIVRLGGRESRTTPTGP